MSTILFTISLSLANAAPASIHRLKVEIGEQIITQQEDNPSLQALFIKVYGEKITPKNLIDAMSEYSRSLTTSSRFDDYLNGDQQALTAEEKQGYKLFNSYGCAACHSGNQLGGTQFKKMGEAKSYFIGRKTLITPADLGLFEVTKKTKDMNVFKVPSLRNVGITHPYYHDGSVSSLKEAVELMGKYQLGIKIPEEDVKAMVTFMHSLTAKSLQQQQKSN